MVRVVVATYLNHHLAARHVELAVVLVGESCRQALKSQGGFGGRGETGMCCDGDSWVVAAVDGGDAVVDEVECVVEIMYATSGWVELG